MLHSVEHPLLLLKVPRQLTFCVCILLDPYYCHPVQGIFPTWAFICLPEYIRVEIFHLLYWYLIDFFPVPVLCISVSFVSISNQLNTTRLYMVQVNLPWFLLSLPILILQVSFASGWFLYNHLIGSFHSCTRNWILLTVLFLPWSNLWNGCQNLGFEVLRILWSL